MRPPSSGEVKYASGEEQVAIINSSRKNEATRPKQECHSVVNVSGDESKIWFYKEQYFIGTWNLTYMNQGKLDMVKQEVGRINIDILGNSGLKWVGMGEFNSGDYYTYYHQKEME